MGSIRAAIYFMIWTFLATRLFRLSREQDVTQLVPATPNSRSEQPPTSVVVVERAAAAADQLNKLTPSRVTQLVPHSLRGSLRRLFAG